MIQEWLHLNSWAGHSKHKVTVLSWNKRSFVVRLDENCLKGKQGEIISVPKWAVTTESKQ